MKTKKTWKEKIEEPQGKIVAMPQIWIRRYGEGRLLIPRPLDIDELIGKTPKRKLITQSPIRAGLASRHQVQSRP